MKDHQYGLQNTHPAEKSLIVFPLIPRASNNLITKQNLSKTKTERKVVLNFNETHSSSSYIQQPSLGNVRELQLLRQTKVLIDSIDTQFPPPKKRRTQDILSLPPIMKKHGTSTFLPTVRSMADTLTLSLPTVPREKCQCSYLPKNDKLENARINRLSKFLRTEETPPMFSIYIRWKNRRNGEMEHNEDKLHEIFESFGEISKIFIKSRCSAIITFESIESACNAVKVMQRSVGKEMKMQVRWLNDMKVKSG